MFSISRQSSYPPYHLYRVSFLFILSHILVQDLSFTSRMSVRALTWSSNRLHRSSTSTVRLFSTTSSSPSPSPSSTDAATTTSKVIPNLKLYDTLSMDDIVSLCKRRGFIFPSSEIYNGFAGFFDYGPLGTELKRNVKDAWWKNFVTKRDDVFGLDSSIIHHPTTWKSSGMCVYI